MNKGNTKGCTRASTINLQQTRGTAICRHTHEMGLLSRLSIECSFFYLHVLYFLLFKNDHNRMHRIQLVDIFYSQLMKLVLH